jgi:hypothetical protein
MGNRDEQLVTNEVSVGIIDALKVIEVQQQHCALAALTCSAGLRLGESVIKKCSIGESGERVVQRLVGKLNR